MKFKSKLKDTDYKDVSVSGDMTIMQRKKYRTLRSELRERKKKGEGQLVIRFIQGEPTIVSAADGPTHGGNGNKRFREESNSPVDRQKLNKRVHSGSL